MTAHPDDDHAVPADPAFDAAWRAASSEAPPAALDAAILAAARRAVDAGPQRTRDALRPARWWWPLAAAASIGVVAIGILQLGTPDRLGAPGAEPDVVSDMPVRKPAPTSGPASAPSPERAAESASTPSIPPARFAAPPASLSAKAGGGTVEQDRAEAPAGAPRQAAARASEAKKASAGAAAANQAAANATGAVAAPAADALRGAPLPVADWIALIRKLRAEGRGDDAARELAAFRRAYPDDLRLLPEDLRDWRPVPPR